MRGMPLPVLVASLAAACGTQTGVAVPAGGCGPDGSADCAARFVAACAAGRLAPVELLDASDTVDVVFDGARFGAYEWERDRAGGRLHVYDGEGLRVRDAVEIGDGWHLLRAADGFAARQGGAVGSVARFDAAARTIGSFGGVAGGDTVLWHDGRFDVFGREGVRVFGDDGTARSTAPWFGDGEAFDPVWLGRSAAMLYANAAVGTALVTVGEDGSHGWGAMASSSSARLYGGEAMLVVVADEVTAGTPRVLLRAFAGDGTRRGGDVDVAATLGADAEVADVAAQGAEAAVFVTRPAGAGTELAVAMLDASGSPGALRALYGVPGPTPPRVVGMWAGWSYAVAFGAGLGQPVWLLRICPAAP